MATRNNSRGRQTLHLDYEAYEEMALKQMQELAAKALTDFKVRQVAIVHRIVSDHGGRISVSDAPGGGARFAIELPLRNGTALLTSRI